MSATLSRAKGWVILLVGVLCLGYTRQLPAQPTSPESSLAVIRAANARATKQVRLNLEAVLFDHYHLPRVETLATYKDRMILRGTEEFVEAIRQHRSFQASYACKIHGVAAVACWRESVPLYSVQLVQHGDPRHGDMLIEADIDLANPDYDLSGFVLHGLLDVGRLGNSNPFRIRTGLGKRGRGAEARNMIVLEKE